MGDLFNDGKMLNQFIRFNRLEKRIRLKIFYK